MPLSTNRLSNLGAFAAMNNGEAGYADESSKQNLAMMNPPGAAPASSAMQYPRPMVPGLMPGSGYPRPYFGSELDQRRNTLLNPFNNPAFGSEYPFFPYNPVFSKLQSNPYLFSYMPFYPAPYGPGRYFPQNAKLLNQPDATPTSESRRALQFDEQSSQAQSGEASLGSTLLAVANYLASPREFEPMAAELPASPGPASFTSVAASLLSLLEQAVANSNMLESQI